MKKETKIFLILVAVILYKVGVLSGAGNEFLDILWALIDDAWILAVFGWWMYHSHEEVETAPKNVHAERYGDHPVDVVEVEYEDEEE